MAPKPSQRKFALVVIDRSGLSGTFESVVRGEEWAVEVVSCSSALEVVGESGPNSVGGLAVSVSAAGPFLTDLLRWTESNVDQRIPTLVLGGGGEEDETASRMVLGRHHVRWCEPEPSGDELAKWLVVALEVHELRSFRAEHEARAAALREARMQLFHGLLPSYAPPSALPCGPPLPVSTEEIQPLREARSQFERSHIQAAVREWGSLKDASSALGISYTSLWRRLR